VFWNWGPCLASCRDDLGVGRGDLSDDQWAVLEPLLPVVVLGRPSMRRRRLIDGIRRRVRTGAPWRDLPTGYGPWQTVHGLFRRWQRSGVWSSVLTGLQARADAVGLITWDVNVDSTICRAHQHAAGARRDGQAQKEPPGGNQAEPDDHSLGRSRGGWTTKIHLACEQGQRPLSLVTAGHRGDSPQFTAVLEAIRVPRLGLGRPRVRPLRVRGDKAYSSREPRLSAAARDPLHDPRTCRSGRPSQASGDVWRAASGLRP
jgi:transposase